MEAIALKHLSKTEVRAKQRELIARAQVFPPLDERPTQLYRHFDSSGRLLYVGISLSFVERARDHKHESDWFDQIASMTIEHFADRYQARAAELLAIKTERPLHNKEGVDYRERDHDRSRADAHEKKTTRRLLSLLDYEEGKSPIEIKASMIVQNSMDLHNAGWGWNIIRLICVGYDKGFRGAGLVKYLNNRNAEVDELLELEIMTNLNIKRPAA